MSANTQSVPTPAQSHSLELLERIATATETQTLVMKAVERMAISQEATEQKMDILIELIKRLGDAINANTAEILFLKQQQGIMPTNQAQVVPPLPSVEVGGRVIAEDKRVQVAPVAGEVIEQFVASSIAYGVMDGKPIFKAKGGKFSKFGVAVYPEILPQLGLDPQKLQFGENVFNKGVLAIVRQGKPVKVIGLAQ